MMDDVNIMKVNKYIPGADGNGRQVIGGFTKVQTTVDFDSEDFKYGLDYNTPLFLFQDPLFPTFDIVLDTFNSPLLIDDTTYTKNCIMKFLYDYSGLYSVGRRQSIYDEFKRILFLLFNSDFRQIDRNKSFYINNIAGLDKITARIVDFEKDKITINLNEDVSMIAAYLIHLYNNLSYSYKDQRQMIPANLLRFNMYIKVHDVRNMLFYIPSGNTTITSFDKSYQIYLLRDCSFDFRKSKNFDDTITVGGFDVGTQTKASSISIDIVYKSIEVETEFPLIMNSLENGSNALILNNKSAEVYIPDDGLASSWGSGSTAGTKLNNKSLLNDVFINNAKSTDTFAKQLKQNSGLNNSGVNSTLPTTIKDYGKTSSQVKTSGTRSTFLDTDTPIYNTDSQGNTATIEDTQLLRDDKINPTGQGLYNYLSSVFQHEWDYSTDQLFQHPQTGPALNRWRDSILGEINLYPFLYNLPFAIVSFFFGGYGGLPPMYINTFARPIPSMEEVMAGEQGRGPGPRIGGGGAGEPENTFGVPPTPEPPDITIVQPGGGPNPIAPEVIPGQILPADNTLNGEFIPFAIRPPVSLDGEHISFTVPPSEYLNGEIIPFTIEPPTPLDGEVIPFTIAPPESLDGEYISFVIPPAEFLNGLYIPYTLKPIIPISGVMDTSFTPRGPLEGVIDTSFTPRGPLEGVIDTSFTPRGPLEGVIDTSFTPRGPLEGVIDTTIRPRVFDLGLLYLPVTKENILPITYLYSKKDKFHSLEDYYVYNKVTIEKSLDEVRIDQSIKESIPFEVIYEYGKVDITKTLNELSLYNNNVEKINNLDVINVIREMPKSKEFERVILYPVPDVKKNLTEIYLYQLPETIETMPRVYVSENVTSENYLERQRIEIEQQQPKPLIFNLGNVLGEIESEERVVNLGSLYEPTIVEKLLEPVRLVEPVKKKVINMGSVYENEKYTGNIFVPNPVPAIIEQIERKEFEKSTIEQNIIVEKPLAEKYIVDEENIEKRQYLNGDTISKSNIKEKKGLDNERLR